VTKIKGLQVTRTQKELN